MKEKRKDNPSATISIRMKEKQDEKFLVLLCWKKGKILAVGGMLAEEKIPWEREL